MRGLSLLIVTECFAGGVYKYLANMCNYLVENNVEVTLLAGTKAETPSNDVIIEDFKGVSLNFVSLEKRNCKSLFRFRSEIKRVINKEGFDVIHLHSSFAGILGRIMLKTKGIKKFYTPHGYSFLQNNKPLKALIYKKIESIINVLDKETITIGISESEYELSKSVMAKSKLITTGLKIVNDDVSIREVNVNENIKDIISIGRLSPQKDPLTFLEIARSLPDYTFTWVGDGPLHDEFVNKIKEYNISNVILTGWIPFNMVNSMLRRKNYIFVQTSLWEGLPLTLLEAQLSSLPIIVKDSYGNTEVVIEGENGYICNTLEDFKRAINNLTEPDKYIKMSDFSRKHAIKKYNFFENIKEINNIYAK